MSVASLTICHREVGSVVACRRAWICQHRCRQPVRVQVIGVQVVGSRLQVQEHVAACHSCVHAWPIQSRPLSWQPYLRRIAPEQVAISGVGRRARRLALGAGGGVFPVEWVHLQVLVCFLSRAALDLALAFCHGPRLCIGRSQSVACTQQQAGCGSRVGCGPAMAPSACRPVHEIGGVCACRCVPLTLQQRHSAVDKEGDAFCQQLTCYLRRLTFL